MSTPTAFDTIDINALDAVAGGNGSFPSSPPINPPSPSPTVPNKPDLFPPQKDQWGNPMPDPFGAKQPNISMDGAA